MRKTLILIFALLSVYCYSFDTGKNPNVSALLSLGLPGGGQFYNEQPWKGALAISIESFLIYKMIDTDILIDDLKSDIKKYESILAEGNLTDAQVQMYRDKIGGKRAKYNRNKNRQNNHYWWMGGTVFLSVIDAYVDGHLYNYNEKKKKLRLNFSVNSVSLSYRF